MSKILLITNELLDVPAGGRALLCKLNYNCLKKIYEDRLVVFELEQISLRKKGAVIGALRGLIDGVTVDTISNLIRLIEKEKISKIFVDGSNFGEVARIIKNNFSDIEVVTFFHNVEARFFFGSFRMTKSLHSFAVLLVNYLAERKAVRYSDKIICLSNRDSKVLHRIYGRSATHVSAMALEDKMPINHDLLVRVPSEKFILFVGGSFYANREGVKWFVKHVVPRIQIKTCIVGRGLEDLKIELERNGKVEVVGAVDSLAEWYINAQIIIAPIFDGSGMKTKVAEALMFGKKIIGTPEAFSGYGNTAVSAGWMCSSSDEFVEAIERATDEVVEPFSSELRVLYEENYSFTAASTRLKNILGPVNK